MKILALDPSLSSTGFAVFENKKLITQGRITTNNRNSTDERIQSIIHLLNTCEDTMYPDIIILEDGYVGTNAKSSLQLAELRGAIIYSYKSRYKTVIHQLPSQIRKNFGLKGNVKKKVVAAKVLEMYPDLINKIGPYSDKQNKNKTSDIYDAISIGVSYINSLEE